jgi:hypothetical protein
VSEAVRRVACVPRRHKVFDQSATVAHRTHRIGPELLGLLVDSGLPHEEVRGVPMFDMLDLENVGLLLGLPAARSRAMRYWSRSLLREDIEPYVEHPVMLSARCPAPGHRGPCRFEVNPLLARAVVPGSLHVGGPGEYSFTVAAVHTETAFGDPFTELIERIIAMSFHLLPKALYDDVGFAFSTGLASCNLASRVAVVLAEELGLPVRAVYGYFLTAPFLMWHHWCEFRVGDQWIAADPFLLNAMRRWVLPGSERWPAHRSTGALVWRVGVLDTTSGSARFSPVTHAGKPAPCRIALRGNRFAVLPNSRSRG